MRFHEKSCDPWLRHHLSGSSAIIVANPEIELCAVCDNNPAVQEKLPAAAKAVPFYTDYEELLEKEHPDVVHLCLPHYLHVPVSEYFASHGVNVFCEKPVGLNTAHGQGVCGI